MRNLTTIQDPVFQATSRSAVDQFFLKLIRDERDLPFIYLCLQIGLLVIPSAILLYTSLLTGWSWLLAAVLYLALVFYLAGPYTLMLHNTSHRKFAKKKYDWLNYYIPWVIGPFMGQSPETYFGHHIGMHHAENNMDDDKSSTLYYQRDSFRGFMRYFGVFLLIGMLELVDYFKLKNKRKLRRKVIRGEFSFILLCLVLLFINWKATLVVFVLPLVILRFMMMAGNWAQHAFINLDDPANSYGNSITCINTVYNQRCFNDGYHIGHHLRPHMHWTEMPGYFLKNQDKYAEENVVVFEGLDYQQIWGLLMFKRYDKLASHFVNLGDRFEDESAVIAFLKSRTRKMEKVN